MQATSSATESCRLMGSRIEWHHCGLTRGTMNRRWRSSIAAFVLLTGCEWAMAESDELQQMIDRTKAVCGRKPIPGSLEDERFDFRRTRLSLNGVPLQLYTYDNLIDTMEDILVAILARS